MTDEIERITAFLEVGGLFNPELMKQEGISDLLIDCRARIAALEAALKPLADMDYWITSEHDDCDTIEECNGLTVAEIRAARAALEGE